MDQCIFPAKIEHPVQEKTLKHSSVYRHFFAISKAKSIFNSSVGKLMVSVRYSILFIENYLNYFRQSSAQTTPMRNIRLGYDDVVHVKYAQGCLNKVTVLTKRENVVLHIFFNFLSSFLMLRTMKIRIVVHHRLFLASLKLKISLPTRNNARKDC